MAEITESYSLPVLGVRRVTSRCAVTAPPPKARGDGPSCPFQETPGHLGLRPPPSACHTAPPLLPGFLLCLLQGQLPLELGSSQIIVISRSLAQFHLHRPLFQIRTFAGPGGQLVGRKGTTQLW